MKETTLNELALFAGAGGGVLGTTLLGFRVVCGVEIDPYCREILLRRQEDGFLPLFPIWDDVQTFDGCPWRGKVDIVTGGFPCQPWSVAGKQRGDADERNLWPDTLRVIREVGPRYCLLENVPGLLSKTYFGEIISGLAEAGYDARWDIVSAAETGALHLRKRLWIVAHTRCQRRNRGTRDQSETEGRPESTDSRTAVANAARIRRSERGSNHTNKGPGGRHADRSNLSPSELADPHGQQEKWLTESRTECSTWPPEPDVGRVAHGVAFRVDRLKALGNGQVPRVVSAAWRESLTV